MNTKKMKTLLSAMLAALLSAPSYAQVTIGSNDDPVAGAILDLKEEQTNGAKNSTRGLLLPRVELSDRNKLYPMFTGTYDAAEGPKYTGLTVYNVNECFDAGAAWGGQGVYAWSGTQWQYVGTAKNILGTFELLSSMYGTTDASGNLRVDIPSGLDARGTTIQPFDLTVNSDPLATLSTSTYDYSGDVVFNPAQVWTTVALAANPTVYSGLQATDMSTGTGAVTAANPWKTRQTVLAFGWLSGCLSVTDSKTITLNQTNYAILAYNNVSPNSITVASDYIILLDTNDKNFRITGNAGWKATVTDTKSIITHTIPATGGADNAANGSAGNDYTLAGQNPPKAKYGTATILLEDNTSPKRAKDFTVTVVQCQGVEDLSGLKTETAANSNRTDWKTAWGTDAILHLEKTNTYKEFYSADFGAAGRWMTTNLAAKAYDSNVTGVTLPASPDASYSTGPQWCYPGTGTGDGTSDTEYNSNPYIGFLYNWPAATGNKNSSTTDQGQVAGPTPGPDEVEKAPGGKYQGICPNGWHLPSDREWNQLEKEIYEHPERYSNYRPDELPFLSAYNLGVGAGNGTAQAGWRAEWESGTTDNNPPGAIGGRGYRGVTPAASVTPGHAHAMKEICGLSINLPFGHSEQKTHGGFSLLMTGDATNGQVFDYGNTTEYWSSSSYSVNCVWARFFLRTRSAVQRNNEAYRVALNSVRCKKD